MITGDFSIGEVEWDRHEEDEGGGRYLRISVDDSSSELDDPDSGETRFIERHYGPIPQPKAVVKPWSFQKAAQA